MLFLLVWLDSSLLQLGTSLSRFVDPSCRIGMTSSESALFGVDAVVLDEVHYLSDISRGTVWEEIVSNDLLLRATVICRNIHLILMYRCINLQVIYCPKEIQLICLSATVKNPDELAGWISEVLVALHARPLHFTL